MGFERYLEAATYDLLYVGIAKVGDTFDRLIKSGHKARMRILGNEPQRRPGARVTDEIYLFCFEVEPLVMQTFGPDHNFDTGDFTSPYNQKRIVADAEKAFVSLLKPEYNIVKFEKYPEGKDGLYGSDFARYAYTICDDLSFNTDHGLFRGRRNNLTDFVSNAADSIFVEGDSVSLWVSGKDFPSED